MASTPVMEMPAPGPKVENIDCEEFAKRLDLSESWVRSHVRENCEDMIPHFKFGYYVRFEWGSEALNEWINRHRHGYCSPPPAIPEGPAVPPVRELARPLLRVGEKFTRGARLARAVYGNRSA